MLSALLRHSVDWERPHIALDGAMGSGRTFQKHQAGLRCLVQPVSSRDRLLFAQRSITVTHRIYFDRVLNLNTEDRFYRPASRGLSARHYVITAWFDQAGQDGRCFCVEAKEIV